MRRSLDIALRSCAWLITVGAVLDLHAAETWAEQLRHAIAGADRVEIAPVMAPLRPPATPETQPFALTDAAAIAALAALIDIDDANSGFHCMCDGTWDMAFSAGGKQLAVVSYHHLRSLRWRSGRWNGDGLLTQASAKTLPGWLDAHGFPDALKAQREAEQKEQAKHNENERFTAPFPAAIRATILTRIGGMDFEKQERALGQGLAAAMPKPELMLAACTAFGATSTTWTSTGGKERILLAAITGCSGKDFAAALAAIVPTDVSSLLGAARLGFREGFLGKLTLAESSPAAARLARVVLDAGQDEAKPLALRGLQDFSGPEARQVLVDVAAGRLGKDMAPARYGQEPNIRPSAILLLAAQGDRDMQAPALALAKDAAAAPSDRAAGRIAVAFLGDASLLGNDIFDLQSYTIGLMAIKAIERLGGSQGLDVLVSGGLDHPWAHVQNEAVLAMQRITGRRFVPEGSRVQELAFADAVRSWWKQHGAAFVAERQEANRAKAK